MITSDAPRLEHLVLALVLAASLGPGAGCSEPGSAPRVDRLPTADGGTRGDGGAVQSAIPARLGFTGAGTLPGADPAKVQQVLAALGYSDEGQFYQAVLAHMKALSAPLARVEFMYAGGGRFVLLAEGLTRLMIDAGFELYGCVNPINPAEGLDGDFEAALTALVKSHPEIRSWQIGNEPDLLWNDHTRFPAFFTRAQPLVRAACPGCKILLAGISNQYETGSDSYQRYDGFLQAIAAAGLPVPAFDVFDFHYYKAAPSRSEITKAVQTYRALLEKHKLSDQVSLWCTETGLYTGDPSGPQMGPRSEEEQARDLPRLVAWLSAEGVERIFFWTLIEQAFGLGIPGFFEAMGLVYDGLGAEATGGPPAGTRKKAYTTFALLAAALRETRSFSRLQDGVYRFEGNQETGFVVWNEGGADTVLLAGLTARELRVRDLVPDAQGNTPERTITVTAGAASIPVGEGARLVTRPR